MMTVRIDSDKKGDLDDIAIDDVTMFRMEWMDSGSVWICAYTEENPDGHRFWLNSPRKITGWAE